MRVRYGLWLLILNCDMILLDYILYFIICSIIIEMLLFLIKICIGIVYGYVYKNYIFGKKLLDWILNVNLIVSMMVNCLF